MKRIYMSRFCSLFLSFALLISPLPLPAMIKSIDISDIERSQLMQDGENSYVYLDKKISEFGEVVAEISKLDEDSDSPVHIFKKHLDDGFIIANRDDVLFVLDYADEFLNIHLTEESQQLRKQLDTVIEQFLNGGLDVDSSYIKSNLPLKTLHASLTVEGKATFESNVIMEKKLRVHKKARFYKYAHFKDHVVVDEFLSAQDIIVDNLTVNNCISNLCVENLSVVDGSVSGTLSINDAVIQTLDLAGGLTIDDLALNSLSVTDAVIDNLEVTNCISNLCVENLSVVDGSVSGTLSINDAVIQTLDLAGGLTIADITLTTASITDAVVDNLTVTNCVSDLCVNSLSVGDIIISNCIPELCVTRGSLIDLSVIGSLSVTDAFIDHLNITNNSLYFKGAIGGEYIGMTAPVVVPTSYTVVLPANAPTAHQVLRANATTPTNLEWAFEGGSALPVASKTIYVTKYGNDIVGDGSFNNPYLTLSKAISIVNGLASAVNPFAIWMNSGVYVENNSAGALAITASGVSIMGESVASVVIMPNTPVNTLISASSSVRMANITLRSAVPLGIGLALFAGSLSTFNNMRILNFSKGVTCSGGAANSYGFSSCLFSDNGIALDVNNARLELNVCSIFGVSSLVGPAVNIGINVTGAGSGVLMSSGIVGVCATGCNVTGNSIATINGVSFKLNEFDIKQSGASQLGLVGCSFVFTNGAGDIDIEVRGAGTRTSIIGCEFSGSSIAGISQGVAVHLLDDAEINISGGSMINYITGLHVGSSTDVSSTKMYASSLIIKNCATDILQEGSATFNFNTSTASGSKIILNDPANVTLAYFDLEENNALVIGSTADVDTTLLEAEVNPGINPHIDYRPSLYGAQSIGVYNPLPVASSVYVSADGDACVDSITRNRVNTAGVRLVSDGGIPFGGTSALRGWDIIKNSSSAELEFSYQNTDLVGQSAVSLYTIMQLDGLNNQVQFPALATQLVFAGDTNLYRSSANVLKTDDNFVVGALTPDRVVVTDSITNQLESSVVTLTELGYLSGVTSSIQTQLNNKVSRSGDTMTGTLQLPVGNVASPSLAFTGSVGVGLSVNAGNLSFSTNAQERMKISSGGVVSIDTFTVPGVIHNNAFGDLLSSLIINADVSPSAAIVDTKLATISTTGKVANSATTAISTNIANAIVARDASGNFNAGTITANLLGNAITATTAGLAINFSGSLLGDVIGTQNATIVSLVGGQTAANIASVTTIVNAATNINIADTLVKRDGTGSFDAQTVSLVDEVATGSVTITPFSSDGIVHNDASGLLSSSLIVNADIDSSAAIADTKLATISTTGKVANSATTATSANTANAIVSRNASGNFSAGTITASLSGNATTATSAGSFSGSLLGDVTGIQGATVVSLVDGQTAANVAAATALATAATNLNTANEIVKRDSTGSFAAQTISLVDEVASGSITITPFSSAGVVHNDTSGLLSSSLIVNADVSASAAIVDTKLATISTAGKVTNSATTATNANTANTIVSRDISGNFSAGTITASLSGNATTATTATSFSGLLLGDITGTQGATVVSFVGGQTAANVAAATVSANSGTNLNTANTLVKRDSAGSFAAQTISLVDEVALGSVTITPFSSAGVVHNDTSGLLSSSLIVNADIDSAAAIVDTKLATISTAGKVVNSATSAASANTANAIVLRDASGNFNAGTITASLTGSASNNVLKSGGIMTGALNMATQNEVRFQDAAGGEYVGINAPAAVPASYILSLPPTVPTAAQVMRANGVTPTNLEWASLGGSELPVSSEIIYVAKYGNDTAGNGSFDEPYLTLSKAIDVVNGLASLSNPVAILISPGIYVEDNSIGALVITAEGVSIVGNGTNAVFIMPNTLSNDFLSLTATISMGNLTVVSGGVSTAIGINVIAGTFSSFINMHISGFNVGMKFSGGPLESYGLNNCVFVDNGTGLFIDNTVVECNSCTFLGAPTLASSPANTGVLISGAFALGIISGGVCAACVTGMQIDANANGTISGTGFGFNKFDIIETSGALLNLSGCTLEFTAGITDIDVHISGMGTRAYIIGCNFLGKNRLGVIEGIGVFVEDNAVADIVGGAFDFYVTALLVGAPTDTSSTSLFLSGTLIHNCTTDIQQQGSAELLVSGSSLMSQNVIINDSANVKLGFFDLDDNNALTIGSFADQDTVLIQTAIDSINHPNFKYLSSLYSKQAIGFENLFANPSALYVIADANVSLDAVTTLRTDIAGIRLVSDTGSPVGGASALRGWDIDKNGTSAELSFSYQNSDLAGQAVISQYTVMQLDGVNNLLQLPTVGSQIVFAGDTNLYRDSANVLKTDDNFIVGTLTPDRVVVTAPVTNQLASSAVTGTELSFLSGATSNIQTQLNGKVAKAGDIMTGTLQLPTGTVVAPSLVFTGSTTTGLSAASVDTLSFSTAGTERMKISSTGTVSIDQFGVAGVVHNDVSGNLLSSLVVDADIVNATISNAKLATIASGNTTGAIVVRDGSGNFATNMITLTGAITNPTDAATKAYVDTAVSTGLMVKNPALVASTTDIILSGLQIIDGISLIANDRVLLVGQVNPIGNGLWLAQSGAWTRPADFASGNTAGEAYVLVLSGNTYVGASWVCNTPTAIIDTDSLIFEQFTLPDTTTAANVGVGVGQIFKNKTGVTLNFRSLLAGSHVSFITNTDDITLTTDATSANTANTIVARDSSGNFSAGTISANLTGSASNNVLKAGDTMTGSLQLPAGTILAPSLNFTGSTTTGLSVPVSDTLSFSTAATERMKISSLGIVAIDAFTVSGVVHNDASGDLSTSLIVNADVDPAAAIVDTKLATISTIGKVSNSATTATSLNTPNTIVLRDGSGSFNAGTIVASLMGSASNNVLKAGDTMTGDLQLPAGTVALPSLIFTGSTTTGLSASLGGLSFSTNALERMKISAGGIISIDSFVASGIVHNDASGNLSSSLIVSADISDSAAIIDTKLATISTMGKVTNSATTATSANTSSAIVVRDTSGNFSAGTITASLSGNATTATSAGSFSGSLLGDVTGTQGATVVSLVDGQTAANVAAATALATAATNLNTANEIVKRDSTGSFAAQTISLVDEVASGSITITPFSSAGVVHNDTSGLLSSSLIVNTDVSALAAIVDTKLATISTAGKVTNSATSATNANTANTIVSRDVSGNFSAGTITASLSGNATTATTATNFSGLLLGDVTGTQGATVVSFIGGQTAANVVAATVSANSGTNLNTANTLVKRDSTGSFAAQTVSLVDGIASGSVTIVPFSSDGIVHNDASGLLSTSLIVNTDIDSSAAIVDTKLATISTTGKVANSATSATSVNTANAIVLRNASGNFSAGTITANLSGNATTATSSGSFSGSLLGDVTGTQSATVVSLVGGQIAADVATATVLANAATNFNIANEIVKRDSTGSFAAQTISLVDEVASGSITITPFSSDGVVHNDTSGLLSSSLIVNADISASAAIVDTKLATISTVGKVANSATTATSSSIANAIVARDAAGNFSAGSITASLTGSASNNVLKAGDAMTGALNMATQNEVRFQDSVGGEYVGINSPAAVLASYTVSLPSVVPVGHQVLRANSITPTHLEWATLGGSALPAASEMIYVTKYGNDATGDGSFDAPYLTLSKAIDVANGLATLFNPVAILVGAGIYVEDNSAGPLTVTAKGVSIVGSSSTAVTIMPNTLSNDLLLINETMAIVRIGFISGGVSTAAGISFANGLFSNLSTIRVLNFQLGLVFAGGMTSRYALDNCILVENGIGIVVNNTVIECNNCTLLGSTSLVGPAANIGVSATGANGTVIINGGLCAACVTGLDVNNNATLTASAIGFKLNIFDIVESTSAHMTISGCSFDYTEGPGDIDVQISGAGTVAQIVSCEFNGNNLLGSPEAIGILISDNASVQISGGGLSNYTTGVKVGVPADTASTIVSISSFAIRNCVTDVQQEGSTTLNFNAGTASGSKIMINDPTNVSLAFFDSEDNNALTIGSTADMDTTLIEVAIDPINHLSIEYLSSLYSTQAVGFKNLFGNSSILFVEANSNASLAAVTTVRSDVAGIRLVSDTGVPVGGTSALRGWDINKNGSAAELAFKYQNSDAVGQSVIPQYAIMQLDGVNNQLQLPTAATQIIFAGDTNLYRSAVNVLKTDDNFIVGTLTPARVVITDGATNQLSSSVVTSTELGYLSGVTSSIQTQLNNKVSRSGDTMTGVLQLPSGTVAAPSLVFTGATTTGLSAGVNNLSFSTSALERMKIAAGGTISINAFAAPGVVHNDASGNLSSSLIVNGDIDPSAAIVDTKLATIVTAGKVTNSATTATSANAANTIVARDSSGNFTTNMITIAGTTTNPTDVATKTYVDNAVGVSGTSLNTPNTLVKRDATGSFAAQTISLVDEVATGSITVTPFNTAGVVHNNASGLLSSLLIVNADVSVSAAIVDTKLATISTAGKVSNSATTATNVNTASTIVARDASGNFSAGIITASLAGNATTATSAGSFSGSLVGDVTGTQSATVVSLVGGQTAANVAAATVLANAATSANTVSAIVRRDASGNFSAGTITASLTGNATTATSAGIFSGSLVGDVTGTQGATVVSLVGGQTAASVAAATVLANAATNLNTASTIVKRDSTGSFTAQTISLVDEVVSGDISLSDSTSATVGNVNKAGVRFIHNFGTNNTFVGKSAGNFTTTGTGGNTAVGASALTANTTGIDNTAIGSGALSANTIGTALTAIGKNALGANTTGTQNTAVGSGALAANITGIQNTVVGALAAASLTGTNNVIVGYNVGSSTTTGSNNIYINGNGLAPANESTTIRIGSAQTKAFIAGIRGVATGQPNGIAVLIDSLGQLGTVLSSKRFKHNIEDMVGRSSAILDLRPVTFAYNSDETETTQFGLIAEEVEAVFPALVVYEESGIPLTVRYEVLPILLLNEMQKQKQEIVEQKIMLDKHDLVINQLVMAVSELQRIG